MVSNSGGFALFDLDNITSPCLAPQQSGASVFNQPHHSPATMFAPPSAPVVDYRPPEIDNIEVQLPVEVLLRGLDHVSPAHDYPSARTAARAALSSFRARPTLSTRIFAADALCVVAKTSPSHSLSMHRAAFALTPTAALAQVLAARLSADGNDVGAFGVLGVAARALAVASRVSGPAPVVRTVDCLAAAALRLVSRAHAAPRAVPAARYVALVTRLVADFSISSLPRTIAELIGAECRSDTPDRAVDIALYALQTSPTNATLTDAARALAVARDRAGAATTLLGAAALTAPRHVPAWCARLSAVGGLQRPGDAVVVLAEHVRAKAAGGADIGLPADAMLFATLPRLGRPLQSPNVVSEEAGWKTLRGAAQAACAQEKFDLAENLLQRAINLAPARSTVGLQVDLALAKAAGNKVEEAVAGVVDGAAVDWRLTITCAEILASTGQASRAAGLVMGLISSLQGAGQAVPGRVWAAAVALAGCAGEQAALRVLEEALSSANKSGEVWTEAARVFLNPYNSCYNVHAAVLALRHALRFTPQQASVYVELVRALVRAHDRSATAAAKVVEHVLRLVKLARPNYGQIWGVISAKYNCTSARDVLETVAALEFAHNGEIPPYMIPGTDLRQHMTSREFGMALTLDVIVS